MTHEWKKYDHAFYHGKAKAYLYVLWCVTDIEGDEVFLETTDKNGNLLQWSTIRANEILEFVYNSTPKYAIGDEVCYFPFGVISSETFVRGKISKVIPSITNEPNQYMVDGEAIYRATDGVKKYSETLFDFDVANINQTGQVFTSGVEHQAELDAEMANKYKSVQVSEKDLFVLSPTLDSTLTTLKHIRRVGELMDRFAMDLIQRGINHDASKLIQPELLFLDEMEFVTEKMGQAAYGTEEYKRRTAILKPMLAHHYAWNSHHPQHYPNWIWGMNLMDVVEMAMDHLAASERGGEPTVNLTSSAAYLGMSDQLKAIIANTYDKMGVKWK